MDLVLESAANAVLSKYSPPVTNSNQLFNRIRQAANIEETCKKRINAGLAPPVEQCKANLLFDLEKDPCEFDNIETQAPSIVKSLKARLDYFESRTMPMQLFPADTRANPSRFGGYWTWWLDLPEDPNSVAVISSGVATFSLGIAIFVTIALYKII